MRDTKKLGKNSMVYYPRTRVYGVPMEPLLQPSRVYIYIIQSADDETCGGCYV